MKLEGAKVVVVGMARSGVAAVELLIGKRRERDRGGSRIRCTTKLMQWGIEVQPQTEAAFVAADLIVLSPGVPADLPAVETRPPAAAFPSIGDLELASWFLQGETIGITGSNGKTTTTAMTGHILKSSGIAAQIGGNIGTPPCLDGEPRRGRANGTCWSFPASNWKPSTHSEPTSAWS